MLPTVMRLYRAEQGSSMRRLCEKPTGSFQRQILPRQWSSKRHGPTPMTFPLMAIPELSQPLHRTWFVLLIFCGDAIRQHSKRTTNNNDSKEYYHKIRKRTYLLSILFSSLSINIV